MYGIYIWLYLDYIIMQGCIFNVVGSGEEASTRFFFNFSTLYNIMRDISGVLFIPEHCMLVCRGLTQVFISYILASIPMHIFLVHIVKQ